jgi:hypothetical protein
VHLRFYHGVIAPHTRRRQQIVGFSTSAASQEEAARRAERRAPRCPHSWACSTRGRLRLRPTCARPPPPASNPSPSRCWTLPRQGRLDCPAVVGARSQLMTGPLGDLRSRPRGSILVTRPAVGARRPRPGLMMAYILSTRMRGADLIEGARQ